MGKDDKEYVLPTLLYENLKSKHRQIRDNFPPELDLKVHRALSWVHRAEQSADDDKDSRFLFLWIAFNATYDDKGLDRDGFMDAKKQFGRFFNTLTKVDPDKRVYHAVWFELHDTFQELINNKYVFSPFWKNINGEISVEEWIKKFEYSTTGYTDKLAAKDTSGVLSEIFGRLYVLRNQLMHGGATWKGSVNRHQVSDCSRILSLLVPLMIDLVMDNPNENWGVSYYPNLSRE